MDRKFWDSPPDVARTICERRYFTAEERARNAPIPAIFERVAQSLAALESDENSARDQHMWYERYLDVMVGRKFLPGGRTLANAGTPQSVVANCIVLTPDDSIKSIFSTQLDAVQLQKAGSGLGFPFARMRPAGFATITMPGSASGPISFIRVYDQAFSVIKQQNRSGANMAVMDVRHPDILEFIHCKEVEGSVTCFNISVGLTDDFMRRAIACDPDPWLCTWEDAPFFPRRIKRDKRGVFLESEEVRMSAREILEEIAYAAWRNGEPGVLFLDTANLNNPLPTLGPLEATNPCVPGDVVVMTGDGPCRVADLCDAPFTAVVGGKEYAAMPFWSTGAKTVFKITTKEGYTVRATGNHLFSASGAEEWQRVDKLVPGQHLQLHLHELSEWKGTGGTAEEGYLLGAFVGIGHDDKIEMYLMIDIEDDPCDTIRPLIGRLVDPKDTTWNGLNGYKTVWKHVERTTMNELMARYGVQSGDRNAESYTFDAKSKSIHTASSAFQIGLVRALFDTRGGVYERKGIKTFRLMMDDVTILRTVQDILLRLGIMTRLLPNRIALVVVETSMARFIDRIAFREQRSREHAAAHEYLPDALSHWCVIEKIEEDGVEDVYDCTVSDVHVYDANGFVSHNCGEQFLHDGDVCNLGAINLEQFIKPKAMGLEFFMPSDGHSLIKCEDVWADVPDKYFEVMGREFCKKVVDEVGLRDTTRTAVRMLDSVIDLADFCVEKVNRRARETRRVGLGIMGLADALMRAMVPYNSQAGVFLAEYMMKIIKSAAIEATEELGITKGEFPLFYESIYKDGKLRRNAALLTVAPTGTTSLVFDVCGGVEPYFSLDYKYDKTAVLDGKTELTLGMNRHLIAAMQSTYPERFTAEFIENVRKTGSVLRGEYWQSGRSGVPLNFRRIFATSMDISPADHVKMQAALQRRVDNSISKTINLPERATVQDVIDVYMNTWLKGCKGCTVYRDKSRVLQVLRTHNEADDATSAEDPLIASGSSSADDEAMACRLDASANGGTPCVKCNE